MALGLQIGKSPKQVQRITSRHISRQQDVWQNACMLSLCIMEVLEVYTATWLAPVHFDGAKDVPDVITSIKEHAIHTFQYVDVQIAIGLLAPARSAVSQSAAQSKALLDVKCLRIIENPQDPPARRFSFFPRLLLSLFERAVSLKSAISCISRPAAAWS